MKAKPPKKITLKELKQLVKKYLNETRWVPYRAVDCDQEMVDELRARLMSACKNGG